MTGLPATAGSPALASAESGDAFLVAGLRAAGAVILGKANLSEWANIRSPRSSSGWSTLGGQTVNPHGAGRNPSGSSSGSAAAVAAGPGPGGRRHRDQRLDRLAGQRLRRGGPEAHRGPGQPGRHRADLGRPGHGGPDDPPRRRRRGAARADGRPGSGRPGDREGRGPPRRLHGVPGPGRAGRRAPGDLARRLEGGAARPRSPCSTRRSAGCARAAPRSSTRCRWPARSRSGIRSSSRCCTSSSTT